MLGFASSSGFHIESIVFVWVIDAIAATEGHIKFITDIAMHKNQALCNRFDMSGEIDDAILKKIAYGLLKR